MTDDKKPTDEFGDIDWDQALSEWETTSFDPEVAKDVATTKPGALAGASRPLYRPPTGPAIRPRPVVPVVERIWPLEEDGTAATRIARVPDELLQNQGEPGAAPHSEPAIFELTPRPPLATVPADEEAGPAPLDDASAAMDSTPRPDDDALPAQGPPLLVPEVRRYDPNEVTEVTTEAHPARVRPSIAAEPLEDAPATPRPPRSATVHPPPAAPFGKTRTWTDERPATEWLSTAAREAFEARAIWLEQEARALVDHVARARGLLACSEILATVGDRERAQALAAEARDLVPSLPLAHRQARALMPSSPSDREDYVEALDAEANRSVDERGIL